MVSFEEFAADLPLARTQWFTSPSAVEEALAEHGINQPTRQASRGAFKAGLATRKFAEGELYSDRYSTALSVHLETPPGELAILIPRSPHGHFVVNGINLKNDHVAIAPRSEGMDIAGPGPIGSDCIAMLETRFREILETLCPTANMVENMSLVKVFAPELRSLGDLIVHLIGSAEMEIKGERFENLIAWTVSLIGHASDQYRPEKIDGIEARNLIARNVQDFIEVKFQGPVHLEDLCNHTGVGIRTVQRCFREYFDLSVTDYVKTIRLDKAYRELTIADGKEENVTNIGLRNGFTHLGRFSVAYRQRFGEPPSETLLAPPSAKDS